MTDDDKIGRILTRMLAVSPADLEAALAKQAAGDGRDLGTLLGADEGDIREALAVQRMMRDGDVVAAADRIADAAFARARGE